MARKESPSSPSSWVDRAELLLELRRLDTAYGDLYRQRARQLAADTLSFMDYRALKNAERAVESLPSDVQRAMGDGNWDQVRALTEELGRKKRDLTERGPLKRLGERLYEEDEIHVDPFSPGFYWYHRREERQLPALRDEALGKLEQAARIDPEWKPLYQERREALKGVRLVDPATRRSGSSGRAELEQRAREALSQGNLDELQKLAGRLAQAGTGVGGGAVAEEFEDVEPAPLSFQFSTEILERARQLGLEPEHFDNLRARFRSLFRHLWHPVFFEAEGNLPGARVSAMLPKDTPDAQRERIVMFVTRPVLSSGGARFVPQLVEEDVLVESFDEGPAGTEIGKTDLAKRLGLERRWSWDRKAIERILQEKGWEVVKSLGLDASRFRLVCIPPDIFGGVGARRGWGKQEIWTHLDGYLATQERKLLALAGGDVRYGGVQDLVGVGMQYDSDRLLVRFAIVDRRRIRAW
jgi:hypothetical protein